MKFTPEMFLAKLPLPADGKWLDGVPFTSAFEKGAFKLEFFAPRGTDYQTAHEQDEFYFIVKGAGVLVIEEKRFEYAAGDALFVPKNTAHHFENFSGDFAAWVVFFG